MTILNSDVDREIRLVRWAALVLALLLGCASGQGIAPPGGPPDKEPPTVRASVPADGTINFKGRTVKITFSEYLNEGGVFSQIVITPIPERTPDLDWSGKTLEIEFRDPLQENRTYAITVGGGVQDISGNRLGTPYTLRFSTGPIIDSGRIAGDVVGKGTRNAFIFAYLMPEDTATFSDTLHPDQTPPDFITPVGDNGGYSLEGLPPGRYRLFAIADEFSDHRYSPASDAFGIAMQDVQISSDYAPVPPVRIRLRPAPLDIIPPQIFSASSVNRSRTEVRFSEPIDTATIRPENFRLTVGGVESKIDAAWRSPSNSLSVLLAHAPLPPGQNGQVEGTGLRDTVGLLLADTARTATFTTASRRDSLPPTLLPIQGVDKGYRLTDSLLISFDEGVQVGEGEKAIALTDTATDRTVPFRLVRRSPAEFLAIPLDTTYNGISGRLSVDLKQFTDYAGNRADSLHKQTVAIKPLPQRGTLQGTLTDSLAPNTPHVILLQSTEEKWSYRIPLKGTGAWEIKDIPSGSYTLSAFRDENGDGKYDYGSIFPYRPGEVFTERAGGIQVRPRWTTTEVNVEF